MTGQATDVSSKELDQTPTWAVAGICASMIIISIVLEKGLHKVGTWLMARQKNALFEALQKVKAELMIMGFISLLLTFFQSYIVKICIPAKLVKTMLPCSYNGENENEEDNRRRLLLYDHRILASGSSTSTCRSGHQQIISIEGLHQLHILIFFLAVLHVVYSAIMMTLGRLKIRGWKDWELQTSSHDYEFSNDPARFRLTHETSFVRAHTSFWTRTPLFFYVGCFFRQFSRSVSKADYLTLRNGFITVHLAPGTKFDFQKYIKRSLEDDFKVVTGVSPLLWTAFVVFLLLNVKGWRALFWASLIPVLIILAVGTKLQAILTRMALEIVERHAVVQGIPLVQGSDKYFWFGRPTLILHLIHFTLFQNAFQITYFLWIWYSFGLKSCFHDNLKLLIAKIAVGVGALCLCSYITLPLYALVTQMGSNMKKSVFDEQTSKAIKKWRMNVKRKQGDRGEKSPAYTHYGISPAPKSLHQPGHTLHRFKTTGHSTRSYPYASSDSDTDPSSPILASSSLIMEVDNDNSRATESVTQAQGP